jgi:hypothetical protein
MYQNGAETILLVVSTRHGENEMTTSTTTKVTGPSGVAR